MVLYLQGKVIQNKIEVKNIIEKPNTKNAPSNIAVVGRYIVEPSVFEDLALQKKEQMTKYNLLTVCHHKLVKHLSTLIILWNKI